MKCIGIIGGTSWESTAHYYAALNRGVKQRLGGLHSAKVLLWSVDFAEIEVLQQSGEWEHAGEIFADLAVKLEGAGAQCILIAANTMHRVAEQVTSAVSIPLLHVGDATASAVLVSGMRTVLLLGTRYTMEQPFLKDRLSARGLEVVVPNGDDIVTVNRIIYEELCLGIVTADSREELLHVIRRNKLRGIEGVILGCTELGMILAPQDADIPLFDTTSIHVQSALEFSLDD
ncbi:MAG: aspartate/glutamate racemase family protein [Firmicutes bacterium]|nr:aspartate/glutamate racemase family protein [Bacillota bacterium]